MDLTKIFVCKKIYIVPKTIVGNDMYSSCAIFPASLHAEVQHIHCPKKQSRLGLVQWNAPLADSSLC